MVDLTVKQKRVSDLLRQGLSHRAIARELGITHATVQGHIKHIKRKEAEVLAGLPQVDGFDLQGGCVRLTRDPKTGEMVIADAWPRYKAQRDLMKKFVDQLCERVAGKGKTARRRPRKTDSDDILFEFDFFDPHIGMQAFSEVTLGPSYNSEIATKTMIAAAEYLAGRARRPKKVVVAFGGDIQHTDNRSNKTEHSGHVLDVDVHYQALCNYTETACIEVVDIAAAVGAEVEIVITPGNHDWHSCVWLRRILNAWYRDCPNVTVNLQMSKRKWMQWGDCLLVWTHGEKVKAPDWAKIIPAEFPTQWGATRHRYMKCGHIHHQKALAPVVIDEQAGLWVEYLEALCPNDAWHAGAGFVGGHRGAGAFEYHRKGGVGARYYYSAEFDAA